MGGKTEQVFLYVHPGVLDQPHQGPQRMSCSKEFLKTPCLQGVNGPQDDWQPIPEMRRNRGRESASGSLVSFGLL